MENKFFSDENNLIKLEAQFENIIQSITDLLKTTQATNRNCLKDVLDNCKSQLRRVRSISVKNECKHEYITDTIDIDPEKSQQITYCVFCESTK
jgi:t-SNARE complex subunit (syntaxin)